MTASPPPCAVATRDLHRDEIAAAIAVVGRGMRDNPLHVAAYGGDPQRRLVCHRRLVGALVRVSGSLQLQGVVENGVLVAVAAAAPAGRCQPTVRERLRLLPRVAALGPTAAARVVAWTRAWADGSATRWWARPR